MKAFVEPSQITRSLGNICTSEGDLVDVTSNVLVRTFENPQQRNPTARSVAGYIPTLHNGSKEDGSHGFSRKVMLL
jgi:hypothetical protein